MADALHLRDAHWNVAVLPAHGGCLRLCEFDGVPVLTPAVRLERVGHPALPCCYFPMIPFSNRIENSHFEFAGAVVNPRENVAGTRHAIHGHGWQAAWQVLESDRSACRLSYVREATVDWPWRYEGRQSFEIFGDTLRVALSVHNLASTPMPCGLGFHPFLPSFDGARLQLQAERVWNGSVWDFPRQPVPVPDHLSFATSTRIADRLGTDHCFDGWARRAVVSFDDARREIVVEGCDATRFLVVYIPAGADYFCVEPATHAVNAMNLADPEAAGLWTLQPGAAREITTSIRMRSTHESGAGPPQRSLVDGRSS